MAEKKEPANRTETGKFKKGKSGNPSGRPKEDPEFRRMMRERSADAARFLVETMNDPEAPYPSRVRCAETILDRAWGKPSQEVSHTGSESGPIVISFGE